MPHPKIIYIEIDEEITSIFDRIQQLRKKQIHLVIPVKAAIFQSMLNLKILKKKSEEIPKDLIIVTTDPIGAKLAAQVGFTVIEKVSPKPRNTTNKQTEIISVNAKTNSTSKDKPFIRRERKIGISDLVGKIKVPHKKNQQIQPQPFTMVKPNRKSIYTIVVVSLILFVLISYIALPGATIYILPKSEILEQPVNVTLADAKLSGEIAFKDATHTIPSYPIEIEKEKIIVFETQSQDFNGVNAEGNITIINSSAQEWPLKEKTQLMSPDGIVFRTKNWANVPPRTIQEENGEETIINGQAVVEVIADPFDIYGNPVGHRGNIEPTSFKIIKLSEYNQERIWGESTESMTGGVSEFQKIVRAEDIEMAKQKIEAELLASAREFLTNYIQETNDLNKTNLVLLDDPTYTQKEILELKISDDIEGKELDKFEVYTKIKVTSTAFDYELFLDILKRDLKSRVHPDMHLREDLIAKDSISYKVIDENKARKELKLSVIIKGVQEYTIQPTSESGVRFVNGIKNKIAGLSVAEAENIVSNLDQVAEVEISIGPFWSTTIPKITENISIKLKES